jgi:Raf kinase inhibitor-like YbhB/YbcL family protein
MSIKSRVFAIGGAVVLAASVSVALQASASGDVGASSAATVSRSVAHNAEDSTAFKPFTISSPNFTEDGWLPVSTMGGPVSLTGCDGANKAPTLRWTNVPSGTESFAFVITDVDAPVAGNFHHWLVWNIPASVTTLDGANNTGFSQGTNDYGFSGYGGPCPPADGQVHHYIFTVYALNTTSVPGSGLTYPQLMNAIGNYVIGATSTIGKFRLPLSSQNQQDRA